MTRIASLLLVFVSVYFCSCLRPPPEVEPDPWIKVEELTAINNILDLYAAPTELYLISNDEFIRLDALTEPVEKRRLQVPFRYYGRPILAEHVFLRTIRSSEAGGQELNFHLTKNADAIAKIQIRDLADEEGKSYLVFDDARSLGAFNSTGTQFMLPVLQLPDGFYNFILFDIKLNLNNTQFESVNVVRQISAPELTADTDNLSNFKYIDGIYYANTLDGAVRIDPLAGEATKIFDDWILDIFPHDGRLYGTGFGNVLYTSTDNGLNWSLVEQTQPIDIQFVDVVNKRLFNQGGIGLPYSFVKADLSQVTPLKLNQDFPAELSGFQDLVHFYGNYYMTVFKELYFTCDLTLEDE